MIWSENVGEISKCSSDVFSCIFIWEVPNCFPGYEALDPGIVSSPWFKAFSRKWRLALIINGKNTQAHLSFFLWKMASSKEIPTVKVHLIALNRDGKIYKACNGALDLNGRFGCWNFLNLSDIFDQKEKISPAGFLTLRCIIEKDPVICNIPGGYERSGTPKRGNNQNAANKEDELISEDEMSSDEEEEGENKGVITEDKGIKTLLENFRQLFTDGMMTDVVLKVDDREFKVHKVILAARSPVFASMFQHDLSEKKKNEVDIPDCTAESFEVFIHYIYCGSTDNMSTSNVYNLYYAADKYQVDSLKKKCVNFMKMSLSVNTFCDVIALSLRHRESQLKKTAVDFFCRNFREIIITSEWQKYLTENPIQGNELFIKASVKGNH